MPSQQENFKEKKKVHEKICNKCGIFKDVIERQKKASLEGKPWRKLICVHPKDVGTLEKWKGHITE